MSVMQLIFLTCKYNAQDSMGKPRSVL